MAEYPFKDFIMGTDDDKQALITAPHVMTEGGVLIPQRGSDEGAVSTQVVGSNVGINRISLQRSEKISAGDSETITIQPREGYRIEGVISCYLLCPDEDDVSHRLTLYYDNRYRDRIGYLQSNSAGEGINYRAWDLEKGKMIGPKKTEIMTDTLRDLNIDGDSNFNIHYENTGTTSTSDTRRFIFVVREVAI